MKQTSIPLILSCYFITLVTSLPITKLFNTISQSSIVPTLYFQNSLKTDSQYFVSISKYGRFEKTSLTQLDATTPSTSTPNLFESIKINIQNRPKSAILLLKVWLLFTFYAFKIVPPDIDPSSTMDIIQKCFTPPYDGSINPIFISIFNFLGVYPAIFASLLLSGSKKQIIPAAPFVFSSFALGFFGLGPYLALRGINTEGTKSSAGFGYQLFESKIVPIILLIASFYLANYGIFTPLTDGNDKFQDFITLFQSKQLVHVSTIDFTILSLVMWEPLQEDMTRRQWEGPSAVTVSLLPIFGPLLYLLLRPRLIED